MAKDNSSLYWKKNIDKQKAETLFELIEENHNKQTKSVKTYKNPIVQANETNLIIREIKKGSVDIRNEIKEK